MTTDLFLDGELMLSRKETHGKNKQPKDIPAFTSRMEKREYYKSVNHFDIRNVLDVKGFLNDIRDNWNTYVAKVSQWIQKNPVKRLVVTGIFTVVLGISSITANAQPLIEEYTYQVKSGEKIETIAAKHGVTPQEILDANGVTSIAGKKILLPKVTDQIVTATVLNIRSQPTTKSSIIGKFKKGEVVKIAFKENGWAGILVKGRVCFVSMDYLTTKQTVESRPTAKTMYVTATSLRVRQAGSMSSAILGSLKLNDRVAVVSTSNGWAKIDFNGKVAYVSATYLTNEESKQTTNDPVIETNTFVIKSGDTFTKIAKKAGVSVAQIQKLNPGVEPTKLKIGQIIKIPSTTEAAANQIRVTAQIGGVDPKGTFRFITADGTTHDAKASGNLINELFDLKGKEVTLSLEGKRGQLLNLVSIV
ncbi:SH3 domain-containing protein [Neobacillus niacini]|uniref:SH3 domain-containing protein n=1 Tax=Neobacillus niacini TaxID=86668 RepID=UPI0007AB2B4E|nr:SH3 domain-containing protein [Neobacillus niacini]MEC1525655.1 SH3 domain-containing protein [Neobacillus niacini]